MFKRIRDYFDKRAEKKFKKYIRTVDIKLEKYKFCYGQYAEQYMNILNDIDFCINEFIKCGGRLIYAYAPDVYQQTKQCKDYCLTDDEDECILNDLIQPVDPNIYYHYDILYSPINDEYADYIQNKCKRFNGRFIYYKDNDIHEQIKYCREHNIKYLISVQYDLIKEFL